MVRRMRRWVPLWLALAACASTQEPAPAEPPIDRVEIEDGVDLDTSDLVVELANHAPSGFISVDVAHLDRLALEIDRRRVESFYREQGYFAAEVFEPEVSPSPEGGVILKFRVREGRPSTIASILVQGAPDPEAASSLLSLREGEPFRYPYYLRDKEVLREHFFRAGYAYVRVSGKIQISRASSQARVLYEVDPGPMVVFGTATVAGSSSLPADSILARVAFEPGEPFDPSKLEITEKREYELSLLGSLRFELDEENRSEVANVAIHVSDALPNEWRIGGGIRGDFAKEGEAFFRASYARRHFFHPLLTFRAELRPSFKLIYADPKPIPNVELSSEIQRDDFLIPRLTSNTGFTLQVAQYEMYTAGGPGVFTSLTRPLFDDRLRVSAELAFSFLVTDHNLSDADALRYGFYNPQRILSLAPALTWDTRDDPLSPREGLYLRLELEAGRSMNSGGGSYLKLLPEGRIYQALGTRQLIFAARLKGGTAFLTDGRLPVDRRFFSGGSESHRGFGRRLLAPEVTAGSKTGPAGGEAIVEGSVELRFDMFKLFDNWLGIVGFVDAADVTERLKDIDLTRVHVAAGPGLRYRTPIGPLRLDFGFRLNRRGEPPQSDEKWAFHFSLGEAF